MFLRINHEKFLGHMIDFFTADELCGLYYIIISADVHNGGKFFMPGNETSSCIKIPGLYPTPEIAEPWVSYSSKEGIVKSYGDWLRESPRLKLIYKGILMPVVKHLHCIIIICKEREDVYVDILCDVIKEKFALECIDLNQLFSTGEINTIQHDLYKIKNNMVDLHREITKETYDEKSRSRDGRFELMMQMTKSDKIRILKKIGIRVTDADKERIDELLFEGWVEDD